MLIEVSDTNVFSVVLIDIDTEVNMSLLLLVIASDKLSITETITNME